MISINYTTCEDSEKILMNRWFCLNESIFTLNSRGCWCSIFLDNTWIWYFNFHVSLWSCCYTTSWILINWLWLSFCTIFDHEKCHYCKATQHNMGEHVNTLERLFWIWWNQHSSTHSVHCVKIWAVCVKRLGSRWRDSRTSTQVKSHKAPPPFIFIKKMKYN